MYLIIFILPEAVCTLHFGRSKSDGPSPRPSPFSINPVIRPPGVDAPGGAAPEGPKDDGKTYKNQNTDLSRRRA